MQAIVQKVHVPGAAAPSAAACLHAAMGLNEVGFVNWRRGDGDVHLCERARDILGCGADAITAPSRLLDHVQQESRAVLVDLCRDSLSRRGATVETEFSVSLAEGKLRQVRGFATVQYDAQGQVADCLVALQDITAHRATMQALSDSEARLEEAQTIAKFGYWEWDFKLAQAKFSQEALRILRKPADWQPDLQAITELVPEDQRPWVVGLFQEAVTQRQTTLRYEVRHPDPDGGIRDVHTLAKIDYSSKGYPRRLLATIQDISELKSYRRQLHSLSFFDPLTALPNRALFVDRLRQALTDAAWREQQMGVLILDLDRFKDINDSLGHVAGDDLLKQTAHRLHQVLRGYDTVARLGGDEFAVVLPEVRQPTDLGSIAAKVLNAFSAPFMVAGKEVFVTASIGGALYPLDAGDVDQLLQFADAALYHAKAKGRHNFQFYSKELTAQASERLTMESELRKGIEREELALYYQPKFELASGRLVGAEALMRWNHPERGLVSPLSFIPLAEDTGLIVPMGEWALRTACEAAVEWNANSARPLKIAVNLSARQFAGGSFAQTVRHTLASTGCRPQWLELEITESLLLDGREEIRAVLDDISGLGVTIAIDDFGTGYSALSYLTRFPVQILKIDRSFVKALPSDKGSAELVKAIVSLGRSLNMALVAEGVETQEQAEHLNALGCELVQGFLFGKPITRSAFDLLVQTSGP